MALDDLDQLGVDKEGICRMLATAGRRSVSSIGEKLNVDPTLLTLPSKVSSSSRPHSTSEPVPDVDSSNTSLAIKMYLACPRRKRQSTGSMSNRMMRNIFAVSIVV